jgi:hypothetical protein
MIYSLSGTQSIAGLASSLYEIDINLLPAHLLGPWLI